MIVEHKFRAKTANYFHIVPLHRAAAILSIIACIAGSGVALCTPALAVADATRINERKAEQEHDGVESVQTECPVLVGTKIDSSIYSDYQGKRVFFCCQNCKAAFAKTPEKYLSRLPQFASMQADASNQENDHANHAHEFSLISLAKPTGILTLSLVALTVCLGLLRRVRRLRPRLILKLHKISGISTLCSGAIHATIVLLTH